MTHKDLLEVAEITGGRIDRGKVFSDFLAIFACTISNSFDPVHREQRKEDLESVLRNYNPEERRRLNNAFRELMKQIQFNVDCGRYQDLLGRAFMEIAPRNMGQDFTPQCVSALVAKISEAGRRALPEKGYFVFNEPTCGSGAIMLSAADELRAAGMNPSQQMAVRMEDLDSRCVHMAYIQMSLYAIPAVIIYGNALSLNEMGRWYTPAYILFDWIWREPMPFRPGRNPDDELLKMTLDPIYRAIRLLGRKDGQNTDSTARLKGELHP